VIVVRLLLRFILVPLGLAVATCIGALVITVAYWSRIATVMGTDPVAFDLPTLMVFGPTFALLLAFAGFAMLAPALIGILIAEVFAIRSWIFHAANGGLSAWIGWFTMDEYRQSFDFLDQPIVIVGAGIAAGFAYWAVAGWNAGFWRPVFEPEPLPDTPPPMRAS
jgi:hypothetical protein